MTRRTASSLLLSDLERREIRPVAPAPPSAPSRGDDERRARILLAVTGVAWWALFLLALALVPEADGAAAEQITALDQVVAAVQMVALVGVSLLLMTGARRWAGAAMLGGGAVFLASAIGCVASGHHSFGSWWYGHAAALVGMIAAGAVALRARPRRR